MYGPHYFRAGNNNRRPDVTCQAKPRNVNTGFTVRRSRLLVNRKELQKQQQIEFLRTFYEDAERLENGQLVFELRDEDPKVRALQERLRQAAEINRQLGRRIGELTDWETAAELFKANASILNHVNISMLVYQLSLLVPDHLGRQQPQELVSLTQKLAGLVLQSASWYQSHHFAQSAIGLGSLGLSDDAFWSEFARQAERKLQAFTFPQLAAILETFAKVGFTPVPKWLAQAEAQADRTMHSADAENLTTLMRCFGDMRHTPANAFVLKVWNVSSRMMKQHELDGLQLASLMHGVAHLEKHHPPAHWLNKVCNELQPVMGQLSGVQVVEVLHTLAMLGMQPGPAWTSSALAVIKLSFRSSRRGKRKMDPVSSAQVTASHYDIIIESTAAQVLRQDRQDSQEQRAEDPTAGVLHEGGQDARLHTASSATSHSPEQHAHAAAIPSTSITGQASQPPKGEPADPHAERIASHSTASTTTGDQHSPGLVKSQTAALVPPPAEAFTTPSLPPAALAQLAWVLGTMGFQPPQDWQKAFEEELVVQADSMAAPHVVDVLHGLAGLAPDLPVSTQVLTSYLARSEQLMPNFGAAGLARVSWALVKMSVVPQPAWLVAYAAACTAQLSSFGASELVEPLSLMACSGFRPDATWLDPWLAQCVDRLPGMVPAALANLGWCLAALAYKPDPAFLRAYLKATRKEFPHLENRDLANAAWALARLRHRPNSSWLRELLKVTMARLEHMDAGSISDLLWAIASFQAVPDEAWVSRAVAAVAMRRDRLSAPQLATVLWALACFRQPSSIQQAMRELRPAARTLLQNNQPVTA